MRGQWASESESCEPRAPNRGQWIPHHYIGAKLRTKYPLTWRLGSGIMAGYPQSVMRGALCVIRCRALRLAFLGSGPVVDGGSGVVMGSKMGLSENLFKFLNFKKIFFC